MSDPTDLSLVPNLIPASLELVYINVSGRHGHDGGYGGTPHSGQGGDDISIRLSYDPRRPGNVQVDDDHGLPVQITPGQNLRLSANGGNGGNGGIGRDGRNGSPGYDGSDATRYSSGTSGGDGGDGEDGGPGTDGARGGVGGDVSVTLHATDMDLCLPISWESKGGKGGAAGKHGRPGRGGSGGRGGSSYSWSEEGEEHYKDDDGEWQTRPVTHYYSNPGGSNGSRGRDGRAPTHKLYAGSDGEDGVTEFLVESDTGEATSFPGRYNLVVSSMKVVDENLDGINEPGEYLIVEEIKVSNNGFMPSPSRGLIKVVIRKSEWLEPETIAPLTIPDSIPIGEEVTVPGRLRAFIRHEQSPRVSGERLNAKDVVKLLAYSERLKREVPEFSGAVPIVVQYPLHLPYPAYINCMTKAQGMRMSWIVSNWSDRDYGSTGDTRRAVRTRITDLTSSFMLDSPAAFRSSDTELTSVLHDVRLCKSKGEYSISESFSVADGIREYTTGCFELRLQLMDPHIRGRWREVIHYKLDIQISEPYEHRTDSQFLLLVNAGTSNESILAMKSFINTRLHLSIDVLNISLTGSLKDIESGHSVLKRYMGRSIIISGSRFALSGQQYCYTWDLIDPQEALSLLMNDTGLLFSGVRDSGAGSSLSVWTGMLAYPLKIGSETYTSVIEHKNRRSLLRSARSRLRSTAISLDTNDRVQLSRRVPVLGQIFQSSTTKRLRRNGNSIAKKLNRQLPMRRFLISSVKTTAGVAEPLDTLQDIAYAAREETTGLEGKGRPKVKSTGSITIAEGLAKTMCCIVSYAPIVSTRNIITSQQLTMIIAALPFPRLCLIFWNIVRSGGPSGISAEAFFRGLSSSNIPLTLVGGVDGEEEKGVFMIGSDICAAVAWAVERALDADIQYLCAASRSFLWDKVRKKDLLLHAPRLATFYGATLHDTISASAEGVNLAIRVLGAVEAALRSRSPFPELFRSILGLPDRRSRLRSALSKHRKRALLFMAPPTETRELEGRLSDTTKQRREELEKNLTVLRTNQSHLHKMLNPSEGAKRPVFADIAADLPDSAYLGPTALYALEKSYQKLRDRQQRDTARAQEDRRIMMSKVYDAVDYVPLSKFE